MTDITKEEQEAFDKLDALVAADKGVPVDDDPQEVVVTEAEGEIPPATVEDPVDAGIEALKKQLADEKAARIEADRRATEAAAREKRATDANEDSRLTLINTAIDRIKGEQEKVRSEYSEALASADFAKAATLQEQMTARMLDLRQLEQHKIEATNKPKPVVNDPVERFASQLSPASAQWVRDHPEYVTNPRKQSEMLRAHEMATEANGLTPDTPKYFEFVENFLGLNKGDADVQTKEEPDAQSPLSAAAAPVTRRQAPPPAAPASAARSQAASVTNPNAITLTAEEREFAKMNGMTNQEYARNKAALLKENRIGPNSR